jgi:hypothetical protein
MGNIVAKVLQTVAPRFGWKGQTSFGKAFAQQAPSVLKPTVQCGR